MTNLIILDKFEDSGRPDIDHEFMLRVEGSPVSYDMEVLSGDGTAMELGYHAKAEIGLFTFGDEDAPTQTGRLLLNREAITMAEARAVLIEKMVAAGMIPAGLTVVEGEWKDFSDHPEGALFLGLFEETRVLKAMTSEEREAAGYTEITDADFVELFGSQEAMDAARAEQDREEAEALARGRARMAAAL